MGCTLRKKGDAVFIPESRKEGGDATGAILQGSKEAFLVPCMISFGKGKALLDSSLFSLSLSPYFLFSHPRLPSFSSPLTGWVSKSSPAGIEVELQLASCALS